MGSTLFLNKLWSWLQLQAYLSFPSMKGFLIAQTSLCVNQPIRFPSWVGFLHGWAPKLGALDYFMVKFSARSSNTIFSA